MGSNGETSLWQRFRKWLSSLITPAANATSGSSAQNQNQKIVVRSAENSNAVKNSDPKSEDPPTLPVSVSVPSNQQPQQQATASVHTNPNQLVNWEVLRAEDLKKFSKTWYTLKRSPNIYLNVITGEKIENPSLHRELSGTLDPVPFEEAEKFCGTVFSTFDDWLFDCPFGENENRKLMNVVNSLFKVVQDCFQKHIERQRISHTSRHAVFEKLKPLISQKHETLLKQGQIPQPSEHLMFNILSCMISFELVKPKLMFYTITLGQEVQFFEDCYTIDGSAVGQGKWFVIFPPVLYQDDHEVFRSGIVKLIQ